ncbi:hypothetical protein ACH4OY_01710 [Micromonospora rubida]|uniref:Uncharacterized protein n=1 Tax=Micromonospora rubida TaxID=2697657 RepID=A0ABW7SEP3_9ACTN
MLHTLSPWTTRAVCGRVPRHPAAVFQGGTALRQLWVFIVFPLLGACSPPWSRRWSSAATRATGEPEEPTGSAPGDARPANP